MSAPSAKSKRAARLIMAALGDLGNTRPNLKAITDHITTQYHVPKTDYKKFLPGCIERGIAFGAIKRDHGRYKIGDAFRDSGRKKAAAPKPRKSAKVHRKNVKSKKLKFKCCCAV